MQSNEFSLGGRSGGKYGEMKALPTGTPVRIVNIDPKKSDFLTNKAQAAENALAAEEGRAPEKVEDVFQALIVVEALAAGSTVAFQTGRAGARKTVEAAPFKAGDRFRHYFNGIYPKREGGWRISEKSGLYAFLHGADADAPGLIMLGAAPKSSDLTQAFNGVAFTVERVKGTGGMGVYYTPMPKALIDPSTIEEPSQEDEAPEEPPAKPAAKRSIPRKAGAAPAGTQSAFEALPKADQDAVVEYVKDAGGSAFAEAKDLVGHVAKDIEHAKAILASLPKGA